MKVNNMSKSASGTIENPGRMVATKSGLNKFILDQGWGMFRTMLEYKLSRPCGKLIKVPPHYTSQKCPNCGLVSSKNRQTQPEFY